MNRPRASEGGYRYDPGIPAFFRYMCFGGCGHRFIDEIVNSPDGINEGNPQRFGDLFVNAAPCPLFV
jgi:hypothetical protein